MASERDFLITCDGIPGAFSTFTGGEVTAETDEDYDGGSDTPTLISGPPKVAEFEIGRRWDSDRDNATSKKNVSRVGWWETTVNVQPLDPAGVADGDSWTYRARLIGQTPFEVNRNGRNPANYKMRFKAIGLPK